MNRPRIYFVVAGIVGAILICAWAIQAFGSLVSPWEIIYESRDEKESVVWIAIRNQSRNLQLTDYNFQPQIVDAKSYTYELRPGSGVRSDLPLSSCSGDYYGPNKLIIFPPGKTLLMSYRYSIPPNAPSPRLVLQQGFLGIGEKSIPLDRPEQGFRGKSMSVPESPVLFNERDIVVRLARAWWDDRLLIVELRVSNQSGRSFRSDEIGTVALWGNQAALYDPKESGLSPTEQEAAKQRIDSYNPLRDWQAPPYADTSIYYVFVPCQEDLGRNDFVLAAYSVESWLWRTNWRVHGLTRLAVSPQPPGGAHANDPMLGTRGQPQPYEPMPMYAPPILGSGTGGGG